MINGTFKFSLRKGLSGTLGVAVFALLIAVFNNCGRSISRQSLSQASLIAQSGSRLNFTGLGHKLVDSSDHGYSHAYGPTILFENGRYHMFFCSSGLGQDFGPAPDGSSQGDWDSIRYAWSSDGLNWSAPRVALRTSNYPVERCACDPSIVFFNGYYYLFYSGNSRDRQTVMFVARSRSIDGPFEKWTGGDSWMENAAAPAVVIGPARDVPDAVANREGWYGAGQQTVVVADGQLHSWYTDDSTSYPDAQTRRLRIFHATSTNGVTWSRAETNVLDTSSVDVKFDSQRRLFVMYELHNGHEQATYVKRRTSTDGLTWSEPETVCDAACTPDFANNIGVSGDREGHLLFPNTLVAFGAPFDLVSSYRNIHCTSVGQTNCWGRWDVYGGFINSVGAAQQMGSPHGYVDGVSAGTVVGWASDPDVPQQSIEVHFYLDGAAGVGRGLGTARADQPRSDVNRIVGIPGNHGFAFQLPADVRDGRAHRLYVYAIDPSGNGDNPLLYGQSVTFTWEPASTPTATPAPHCERTARTVTIVRTESNSELDGWAVARAADRNTSTVYSSRDWSSLENSSSVYVAAWFDAFREIKDVHLTARTHEGRSYGFPESYAIYLTSEDNSRWELVGRYSHQPGSDGAVHLALDRAYFSYGILIVPERLRREDPAGRHFQLAEITPVYYETVCR